MTTHCQRLRRLLSLLLLNLSACLSAQPVDSGSRAGELRDTIDELYAAFCFDAGGEPDWETQRRIFLDGAAFVPPVRFGRVPAADDTDQFLSDFRSFATSVEFRSTGFHERIVGCRIESFGGIAHAFVAFEGFVPGTEPAQTRGLDSIQFVHDGDTWRLVSFTTQYEDGDMALPERFLVAGDNYGL